MASAFQLEELDGQVALVTFDVPNSKVNTFSQPVIAELSALVDQLEKRTDLKGLLLKSGKRGQFIAGADLRELGALAYAPPDQVKQGIAVGHVLFDRISRLPFPTVALVDGNSLGGGTELTLSMDYRILSNSPGTRIGLPEIQVGLIPGWGGTQRLPRLVGVNAAITMICTGEPVDAKRAVDIGLAFDAVPAENLVEEGRRLIDYAQSSGEWKKNREQRSQPLGLSDDQNMFAFGVAAGQIQGKTKGQYPAPLAALKAIRDGINVSLEDGLKIEQETAMEVVGTTISANLIGVFFMNNGLSRDTGVSDRSVAPKKVDRIGVLGAGLMGAGIATAHARSGIPSGIVEVDDARLADGMKRAADVVAGRIKIGRATPQDMQQMLALMSTSTSTKLFSDCDVVVEAVTENEKIKTQVYAQLGEVLKDDAILASNTSTISITRMAESAPNPERFIGMHFFFPVDRMKLVEVIRGAKTSDETVATIVQLSKRIRKTPIVVNDCAGFLVNRILLPYMNESLQLLVEGASMDDIDKAATKFGMPVGPIALHDMVGLDTACYAGKVMVAAYSDRSVEAPLLEDMVKAGRLGKKSGAGFRAFQGRKGKPQADPSFEPLLAKHRSNERQFERQELEDRMFLPMLFEAVRCLEDNIVREPSHVDMGLILGIGFPPFRGGLLRWCDTEGAGDILKRAEPFVELGKRFEAPDMLQQMAKTGELFYPPPNLEEIFGAKA